MADATRQATSPQIVKTGNHQLVKIPNCECRMFTLIGFDLYINSSNKKIPNLALTFKVPVVLLLVLNFLIVASRSVGNQDLLLVPCICRMFLVAAHEFDCQPLDKFEIFRCC